MLFSSLRRQIAQSRSLLYIAGPQTGIIFILGSIGHRRFKVKIPPSIPPPMPKQGPDALFWDGGGLEEGILEFHDVQRLPGGSGELVSYLRLGVQACL